MNLAFTTVVVATDFSEPSELALEYARVFARRFGATLRVVHVLEIPAVVSAEVPLSDAAALADRAVAEATAELAKVLTRLADTSAMGDVLVGHAADSLVQYASDYAADLIVMGTHGRRGLAHLFLGSVAERVIRAAPCPVFTVKDVESLRCAWRDVVSAAS